MKLNNLDFGGYVFGQSGIQGFFGEDNEYPHHAFYRFIPGFSFENMVFVAKTVTLQPKVYPVSSNTEVVDGYKLKRLFPSSIWWSVPSILKGYLVNAVGLPNPGIEVMLQYNKWQERTDAFQISVMLMEQSVEAKLIEAERICSSLEELMPSSLFHYALQINFSCPNTGHKQNQDEDEIITILQKFRSLLPDVALIPKFALTVEPATISRLKQYCDAFCVGNTIPFGEVPEKVDWKKLFKGGISPLIKQLYKKVGKVFAGGLSGKPLFPVLIDFLIRMRQCDTSVRIIAGGGIMRKRNIDMLASFGIVKGIAIGSAAITRPWRMRSLIDYGNKVFKGRT